MSKYLLKVTETYRCDSESEAAELIDAAKKDNTGILQKFTSTKKEQKVKGEVVDSWTVVSLTKQFTSEKEPDIELVPNYDFKTYGE